MCERVAAELVDLFQRLGEMGGPLPKVERGAEVRGESGGPRDPDLPPKGQKWGQKVDADQLQALERRMDARMVANQKRLDDFLLVKEKFSGQSGEVSRGVGVGTRWEP
eukprot:TRINITY_DN24705_c0_g1_i1.p3 TRINITY_DN24705_c0_g1~~TRINITY_DN24705_c0_g1_i1.p3  ORF type:complete len:108 (+),score=5.70 TRINITY_DN24705_c0_g1_i1:84-407(+)